MITLQGTEFLRMNLIINVSPGMCGDFGTILSCVARLILKLKKVGIEKEKRKKEKEKFSTYHVKNRK